MPDKVMDEVIAALDVGGSKVLGALVSPSGAVQHQHELPTAGHRPGGADPELAATATVLRGLLADAAAAGQAVRAIGAGFPEYVYQGRLTSTEVMDWSRQPADLLAEVVAEAGLVSLPVTIESDVRAGALAEARLGAGVGAASMLYCSWGTGLSSTLVMAGRCWNGHRGEAIALGELTVPSPVDPAWPGNLERYASGLGIAERYAAATGTAATGARDVSVLADDGDQTAQYMLTSAGHALGVTLAGAVSLIDPAVVVLGGGLGCSDSPAVAAARRSYTEAVSRRPSSPPLLPARLGTRAGVIGAALATTR